MQRRDVKEEFEKQFVVDRLQGLGPTMTSATRTYHISKNAKTTYQSGHFTSKSPALLVLITFAWSL